MQITSRQSLGIALCVAALLPLSHGARQLAEQNLFVQESVLRQAWVVDHVNKVRRPGEKNTNEVHSVVEFIDDNGTRRSEKTNVASYPPQHAIGDEIQIRYHRTQTGDVRDATFAGLRFESAFYLIPGLITLTGGLLLFFKRKNNTRT